ncbi:MAG: rRNA maturation RNase YbeY [Phaeodactylibacter sp.]|nr:rRNA maturation RNase YbeY [Phaeodactylibacter sp.]MCB9303190.1 rRNA maturation RNase YbeY [Lewinellaceae bacterium]
MMDFSNDWWEEEEQAISFNTEDIDFELPESEAVVQWIQKILQQEEKQLLQLTYIFCSDEYLFEINQEYLSHDTYTDIITFPYTDPPLIEGDIFISIDRVRENARNLGLPFEQELHRVMIHGVLHLCGYPDKTTEEAAQMRTMEDKALALFEQQ